VAVLRLLSVCWTLQLRCPRLSRYDVVTSLNMNKSKGYLSSFAIFVVPGLELDNAHSSTSHLGINMRAAQFRNLFKHKCLMQRGTFHRVELSHLHVTIVDRPEFVLWHLSRLQPAISFVRRRENSSPRMPNLSASTQMPCKA
jgi:hypothetical protein